MLKIVLATDFSEASENAYKYVLSLTEDRRLTVYVAHVYKKGPGLPDLNKSQEMYERFVRRTKQFSTMYPDMTDQAIILKSSVYTEVDEGDVVEQLVSTARSRSADAIAIGAKRPPGLFRQLFGSLSQQLISDQPFPVLVVPQTYEGAGAHHVGQICFGQGCWELLTARMKILPMFSHDVEVHSCMMPTYHEKSPAGVVPATGHDHHHLIPDLDAGALLDTIHETEIDFLMLHTKSAEVLIPGSHNRFMRELFDHSDIPVLFV